MPAIVNNQILTGDVLGAKIPVFMDDHIHFADSDKYLFEYLTRQFNKSEEVTNMKVEFMEMRPFPLTMTVTAPAAAATTEIPVDHPEYAHLDQLIYNTRTDEFYLLQEAYGGATAAGSLTVVNQQAGTGGITNAVQPGDILIIGPEAHAEGEALPAAYSTKPVALFTYLMQSDRTRKNSDLAKRQGEYGMKQLLIDRKMFWIEYKRAKNLMFYIGKQVRDTTSAGGPRRHTMRGLREWITTNRINYNAVPGNMTLASVGELMRRTKGHSASSATKVGIAGQNAYASISALPIQSIRTTVSETEWGKRLSTLVTPHGNLAIGYDQMLTAENGLDDVFCILDPAHIYHLNLVGEKERLLLNINNALDIHNDVDAITGTYGLKVALEELHAWGYGIH